MYESQVDQRHANVENKWKYYHWYFPWKEILQERREQVNSLLMGHFFSSTIPDQLTSRILSINHLKHSPYQLKWSSTCSYISSCYHDVRTGKLLPGTVHRIYCSGLSARYWKSWRCSKPSNGGQLQLSRHIFKKSIIMLLTKNCVKQKQHTHFSKEF